MTRPPSPAPAQQPRWLTGVETDAWLNLAQVLMLMPTALDQQLREDAGMSALEAAAPGHVHEVRRLIFDHLTDDDVTRLRDITAKLLPILTGR